MEPTSGAAADCLLPRQQQRRNLLIYGANWGLIYLASPVTYVGVVQAAFLNRLEFDTTMANLPTGVYLWTSPLAVLIVWAFPQVRMLKPLLIGSFLLTAGMGGLVTAAAVLLNREAVLLALSAHAAVWGCCNGVVFACQWEMVGRGIAEARRGLALALAFGAGPVLAVLAAVGSQLILAGGIRGIELPFEAPQVSFPWNFAVLFAASVPILGLAALLSGLFVVPEPAAEVAGQPAGLVLKEAGQYFGHRLILIAALGYVLVYSGLMVNNNISLYPKVLLDQPPDSYAGLLLVLRYGFKIVAGFFLGGLLMMTNPKTLLVLTPALIVAGVVWALTVPWPWFLVCFGLLGAGELFGVYFPNYILGCSTQAQMRRHMALTCLIAWPVGFAPVLYGFIADFFGPEDRPFGFQVSFLASLAILTAAIFLVLVALPARPRPKEIESRIYTPRSG